MKILVINPSLVLILDGNRYPAANLPVADSRSQRAYRSTSVTEPAKRNLELECSSGQIVVAGVINEHGSNVLGAGF